MPKYLIQGTYSSEGLQGLIRDKPSGRRAAVTRAIESIGGKVEAVYFAFGDYDVVVLADVPDNVAAAAVGFTVSSTGLVRTRTMPLLTWRRQTRRSNERSNTDPRADKHAEWWWWQHLWYPPKARAWFAGCRSGDL